LSDLTPEEFNMRKGGKVDESPNKRYLTADRTTTPVANAIDWRNQGVVTRVKD